MATYTDEEYEEMEAALAERNRGAAEQAANEEAERKAAEDLKLKPLREWLAQAHVQQVATELDARIELIRSADRVTVYAYNFLTGLTNAAGPLPLDRESKTDAE